MSFAPVISSTGIIAPTYADILGELQGAMRSIYGSDIYLGADSQDGQFLAIMAQAIKDQNDAIIAAYNAFSPLTAQGAGLSTVVKINGIRRLPSSNSTAVVTIVGQAGTTINSGQITDPVGVRWALPTTVVIPPGGTIDVTATAVDPGAIPASPGTLTAIATPTRGWQTVTNAAAAEPGLPVESDATLRQRQSVSTAIPALSVLDAILGGIKNILGVGRAFIYENDTGTTDADGVPGHSISAVVEGGDVTTIGETIARYKTPGTGTYGSTSVNVVDAVGVPSTINFFELALVEFFSIVFLTPGTGYLSSTGVAIQASIGQWLTSLAIGQDSSLSKLWSPVNLTGDAATAATGLTQAQLDALGDTYDASAIYQARQDMVITGGPYIAGVNIVHVINTASLSIGKGIALELDDGSFLVTGVTGKSGTQITMADNIPTGRSAPNGNLMYVAGDVTVAFNEAAFAVAADTTLEVA